jgi:membrane fusion protein (multidrug efflux system)
MRVVALTAGIVFALIAPAYAQMGPGGPPAVGVVAVQKHAVTETEEFVGRVQATDKVDLIARVTAFLEKQDFVEGSEVKQGDLLYELERGPFESDLANRQAQVAQAQALLRNANITLNRAQTLLNTPAGQRSTVDDALAQVANFAAQVQGGQAQVRASQINLDYTQIHAPISGKISRTAMTIGNVVSPSSGPLATIVSQDPMYVTFPIPVRTALDLRDKYASNAVVIRIRLPNGKVYGQTGLIDYSAPTVAANTDTLMWRGRIPNPVRPGVKSGETLARELVDGEFVTVLVEGVQPVQALAIPRAAVLSDQQGSYVYVVDGNKKAEQRRIQLGQSTPETAVVMAGLKEGESVIADGIQRVRPGIVVSPAPFTPLPAAAKG